MGDRMHTETNQGPRRLLHTVKETQEALRVSHATVWRMIAAGTLKTVRVGRRRLVTNESLAAVAQSGAATVGEAA
jgi:excisionase family DNA binding protein